MTTTQITAGQLNAVSKLLAGRKCRRTTCREGIEVRGTSRIGAITLLMADIDALGERLGLLLIYVDPAIYDATAR